MEDGLGAIKLLSVADAHIGGETRRRSGRSDSSAGSALLRTRHSRQISLAREVQAGRVYEVMNIGTRSPS
jgi:hypothetical protein